MPFTPGQWDEFTLNGVEGWLWWGGVFVPKDFDVRNEAAAVFVGPHGGRASVPAVAQGEPGLPIRIDPNSTITEIEYADPTPVSETWTVTNPGDATHGPMYKVARVQRKGATGPAATFAFLGATDLVGAATAGWVPSYVPDTGLATGGAASGHAGVMWSPQKVGGRFWPASIDNTTAANGPARTLCPINVPAQPFDWRPGVNGCAFITGTGADVVVDLVARATPTINNSAGTAANGDEVGRGWGVAGIAPPRNDLIDGPPAGSVTNYGRIAKGVAATIYLRAERRNGSDSFTTDGSTTKFSVDVLPVP